MIARFLSSLFLVLAMEHEVKLLGSWASPYVYRVIWALKLKGVEFEYIEEDLSNKSELLLKSNPVHKKVPVLIHGDRAISESSVILEYIDEVWPQNPLFPKDVYERALTRFWINFPSEKSMIFRSFYLSTEENREKSRGELVEVLKIVEDEALKGNKFFGGDNIGILDIFYGNFPHWFEATEEIMGSKVIEPSTLPRLYAWVQRFKQVPLINQNLPPYQDLLLHLKRMTQRLISQPPNK